MKPVLVGITCLIAASIALLGAATDQRDASNLVHGTARVAGVVLVAQEPPQPVRRVIVSLFDGVSSLGRHTITDDEGRFSFDALPEGRYEITAVRPSYVAIPYGATRVGRPAAPLIISSGQQLAGIQLFMLRGGVITGTVRDETGDPLRDLEVRVAQRGAGRVWSTTVRTDDLGEYRVFGLSPGTYTASAQPQAATALVVRSDADVDAALRELQRARTAGPRGNLASGSGGAAIVRTTEPQPQRWSFAPVYYPNVFTTEEAAPLAIAAGEERSGVDITVRMMNTSAVAGRVVGANDRAPSSVEIGLSILGATNLSGTQRTSLQPDGAFRFSGVAPGRYLLTARATSADAARASMGLPARAGEPAVQTQPCRLAAEDVRVHGDDLTGLSLLLQPCPTISGRVAFVGSTDKLPESFKGARISLVPDSTAGVPMIVLPRTPAVVDAEGRFALGEFGDVLPGVYHVGVDVVGAEPGRGWWVQSANLGGQDVLDAPIRIEPDGPSLLTMVVSLTERHTALSGVLETSGPRAPSEFTVIAFATDPGFWRPPFRRVRSERPAAGGQYRFHDLPPGEYHLAALTDLAPDDWRDPDFLRQIVDVSIRLTIAPGEEKVQGIRIAGGETFPRRKSEVGSSK